MKALLITVGGTAINVVQYNKKTDLVATRFDLSSWAYRPMPVYNMQRALCSAAPKIELITMFGTTWEFVFLDTTDRETKCQRSYT